MTFHRKPNDAASVRMESTCLADPMSNLPSAFASLLSLIGCFVPSNKHLKAAFVCDPARLAYLTRYASPNLGSSPWDMSAILLLKSMNARSPLAISTQMQFVISWENPIELMSAISWWTSMTFNPMPSLLSTWQHTELGWMVISCINPWVWHNDSNWVIPATTLPSLLAATSFLISSSTLSGSGMFPGYATTPWDQKRSWALTLQSGMQLQISKL